MRFAVDARCWVTRNPPSAGAGALVHDRWFWLALAAGPVTWVALHALPHGTLSIGWERILLLALIYPILEEWLFRGLLQPALLQRRGGAASLCGFTAANGVTSLLFGAAHLYAHTPVWAALVIPPSLLFGWFRDRYDSVMPALLLHVFFNAGYFALVTAG